MFKDLTPEEEQEFRKWARNNYKPDEEIHSFWHPVVRDECAKMNQEYAKRNDVYVLLRGNEGIPPDVDSVWSTYDEAEKRKKLLESRGWKAMVRLRVKDVSSWASADGQKEGWVDF